MRLVDLSVVVCVRLSVSLSVYTNWRMHSNERILVTFRFTNTSSALEFVTVNALYKLLTYLLIHCEIDLHIIVEFLSNFVYWFSAL